MFDVKNKLWIYWLAMFRWQATQHGEWWPPDLTNIRGPGDIAHLFEHLSAQNHPKKPIWVLFIDVFPSKVSHLFHTQTLSTWIVNLWWWLIIWPASEALMRSYFSWMTSPQITSGKSRLQVLTCFGVFLSVARRIKLSFFSCFPAGSGLKFVKGTVKVLNPNLFSTLFLWSVSPFGISQLLLVTDIKLVCHPKMFCHLQTWLNALLEALRVCFYSIVFYHKRCVIFCCSLSFLAHYQGYRILFLALKGLCSNHRFLEKNGSSVLLFRFFKGLLKAWTICHQTCLEARKSQTCQTEEPGWSWRVTDRQQPPRLTLEGWPVNQGLLLITNTQCHIFTPVCSLWIPIKM